MRENTRLIVDRNEQGWVRDVLRLETPKSQQDLRKIVFLLAKGDISAKNLGKQGYKSDPERSTQNAGLVLQKLQQLREGMQGSELQSLPESERLFRMLGNYEQAFSGFLQGKTWAAVPRDVGLLSATLDESDVRSVSYSIGVERDTMKRIRTKEDRKIVDEYREHSLLGPDTVNYLSHKVPVATLQYFLDSFTPEQLYESSDNIYSPALAVSVAADPENMEYIDFVAAVVANRFDHFDSGVLEKEEYEAAYPDLDWEKPQHTLRVLFDVIPGTLEEKTAFLQNNVMGHSLMLEDIVSLVKMPAFADDSFYKLCDEYNGIFVPDEIMSMLQHGCDIKKAKELYDSLPELMQGAEVVIALLAVFSVHGEDEAKLKEFTSYLDLDVDGETFSTTMLPWFFDTYEKAKADTELLKKSGVRSFYHIYELSTDPRVPVEYSALVHATANEDLTSNSSMRSSIVEWYTAGITAENIEECKQLWDDLKGVPWYAVDAKSIKAYVELKKDPAKIELIKYVYDTYDKVPAEIAVLVNDGYSKEVFDAVESRGLFPAWMAIFKEFPQMAQEYDLLTKDEKKSVIGASITGDLLPTLRKAGSIAEAKKIFAKEEQDWEEAKKKGDAYGNVLDRKSERHKDYIEYFSFFGITPEYMSEKLALTAHRNELDDVLVNHIILSAYIENKLPENQLKLIEQNNIFTFTRYPVEVLWSMAEGYTSESDAVKNRVAITLFAKTDWNNSLDNKSKIVQAIHRDHQTHIYEVATKADFFQAMRQVGEAIAKDGKKISLTCFDGHGSDDLVQLGFPYSPRSTELTKSSLRLLAPLQRFLTPDAQLVLSSCSSAEGGKEADNFAVSFAKTWPRVEVFASNKVTGTSGIRLDDEGRVLAIEYTAPNAMEIIKVERTNS